MATNDDTIDVREAHAVDAAALDRYLTTHLVSYEGPCRVRQFAGGQSNPTFLVSAASGDYVLRKKPPGALLPSAHQVEREYRVMRALDGTGVPVPRCLLLCDDPAIIGTPFYVMERVPGRVLWDPQLPGWTPEDRRALYEHGIDVLAALHQVRPEQVGLADFGKAGNYFARQVARWTQQYAAARTDEVPSMVTLGAWLEAHVPPDEGENAVVHGDFRLDNFIVDAEAPRIVAVIDWELSTLGHPLADVAYSCLCFYITPEGAVRDGDQTLTAPGIPSVDALVARYAERTGRDARPYWPFCIAFSLYRLASIAQGIYRRGLQGNASSAHALKYRDTARRLSTLALTLIE